MRFRRDQPEPGSRDEFAEKALQILRDECGLVLHDAEHGPDPTRYQFVRAIVEEDRSFGVEFRFIGALGFGGKFHLHGRHFLLGRDPHLTTDYRCYVSCYPEDATPERQEMIERANERLSALADEYTDAFKGEQ